MTIISNLWRDALYSVRSLARTPGLTATIILTIGLGLGATTAMIAVVRAVLVNRLPYAAPDELYWVYTDNPPFRFRFSVVDYRALEVDHPTFSAVAAYQTSAVTLTERGIAERVTTRSVTGSYFPLLGQTALVGRLFDPSDDTRNDSIAVLTAPFWVRRFGNDPSVVGRTLSIDGASYTVVGVLENTNGPFERDTALFTAARWPAPKRKGPFFTMALARIRPDVSRAAALSALRATNARLFPIWKSSYQDENASWGLLDLKTRVVGDVGPTLYVVLAAVGCVLLIACANAINLLIARALGRSHELAIRTALGASRGRLLIHLMVESAVLTAGATLVGVTIAVLALKLVTAFGVNYIPRIDEIRMSAAAGGWLALLAAASGLLIFAGGLVPALQSTGLRLDSGLRSAGRSATDNRGSRHVRRALVAAEFALATPLIVAAVLVMSSLDRLMRVPVGLDIDRLLTAQVSLPGARFPQEADRAAFWQRALQRLSALPGVEVAALADARPPNQAGNRNNFELEDRPTPPGRSQPICTWVAVSGEFFKTVGLRLDKGRLLDEFSLRDNTIVVDRAWANRFFPGEEVVGRRLRSGGCSNCPWTTVVGVVSDVKWRGLDAPDDGTVYWPFVDFPSAYLVLRAAGNPVSIAGSLQQTTRELDPGLAVANMSTGHDLVADALATPRYLTVLIGMFALTALVLSAVGVHGVLAYFVQQHTREIGIRLALGGEPAAVRRMVVLQGLRLVAIGVIVGIGAAVLTSRFLRTVLFDVSPTDLRTMVSVPLALVAVATIACLAPGRRAARVDPAEILRES